MYKLLFPETVKSFQCTVNGPETVTWGWVDLHDHLITGDTITDGSNIGSNEYKKPYIKGMWFSDFITVSNMKLFA